MIRHDRAAWAPDFAADRLDDPELARFIELRADETLNGDGARAEVLDRGGTQHAAAVNVATGHASYMVTQTELAAEVRRWADDITDRSATQELIGRVITIEAGSSIRATLALVVPEQARA